MRSFHFWRNARGPSGMLWWSGVCLAAALVGLPMQAVYAADDQQYTFCVKAYKGIAITDADVDDILKRATAVLAATNPSNCAGVTLSRTESVSTYDEPQLPSALGGQTDFTTLTSTRCIKVVTRITWCGVSLFSAGGGLGCSPTPGKVMIVVRALEGYPDAFNRGVEPITWLHEFGHNLGLLHNPTRLDVMYAGIDPQSTKLASNECSAYGGRTAVAHQTNNQRAAAATPLILPANAGNPSAGDQSPTAIPLDEFVKHPFTKDSIAAASYYRSQLQKAQELLFDPSFAPYRPNIIALLGVIGTPDTIQVLVKLLETPVIGTPGGADVLSRFAALTAIGTIANRLNLTDNKVSILKSAMDFNFWTPYIQTSQQNDASKLTQSDVDRLITDLTDQALQSYALTGTKAASSFLQTQKAGVKNAAMPEAGRQQRTILIDQAIKLNADSARKGALDMLQ